MAIKPVENAKSGLVSVIQAVLLFVVLIAIIGWAKRSPDTAQAVVNKLMDTSAAILIRICDWVTTSLGGSSGSAA